MTREEFISTSIEFIENHDYKTIKKGIDFYNNVILKAKQEELDKEYFGVAFMEQVISLREVPKNYEYLLNNF